MVTMLPTFRYHPNPILSRVFEPFQGICPCCCKKRGYSYVGPCYSIEDLEGLCPWCISNGEAARKFDATFILPDAVEHLDNPTALDELLHRTPAYFVAQEEPWPAHCGDYCAVIAARPSREDLAGLSENLKSDFDEIQTRLGIPSEQLQFELQREYSPLWLALFQCLHCGTFRITGDYE